MLAAWRLDNEQVLIKPMLATAGPLRRDDDRYGLIRRSAGCAACALGRRKARARMMLRRMLSCLWSGQQVVSLR